jgi:peptidyl-prolyl cis-trans isomerase D
MLQRIRDGLQGQKWLAWVVLGAIGATFVFWGGSSNLDFRGVSKGDAAKVDGEAIPAEEAARAWSAEQQRWSQQRGTDIPPAERTRLQDEILDQLVLRKVLDRKFANEHYRVGEAAVLEEIQTYPVFKDRDGKYDPAIARDFLKSNGMSENDLMSETRFRLQSGQLQQGIGDSNFLTRAEATRLNNLENEEREVQYVSLPADKFEGATPIDDAAIKSYYAKNGDRFMTNESVSLDYAELRLEQLATKVQPTEADLRKEYEDNKASYVLAERRRARHILIPVEGDNDAAALKKAQGIFAEAKSGKDFAELAKKYSSDDSGKNGGDLGLVERSAFVGPFGDALFGMKVGEITGPVKSQFGYHIIKLEEIQPAEGKPFEAVRAEIDSQYRKDKAAELFSERQDQLAEMLEKGDADLDAIAQKLDFTRGSVAEFLRGGGAEPLGSSADLQQAVFSDAALNQGHIGGPVALGEDRLVIFKVTGHHKSEPKTLETVRTEIETLLRQEHGIAAAKAAADGAVKKIESGDKLEAVAQTLGVAAEPARFVSRGDPSMPAALRTAVFEAPRPEGKSIVRTTTLDNGATAIFVITRTRVGDSGQNPQLARQLDDQLRMRIGTGDVGAWVAESKRKTKVVKNPKVFE